MVRNIYIQPLEVQTGIEIVVLQLGLNLFPKRKQQQSRYYYALILIKASLIWMSFAGEQIQILNMEKYPAKRM